MCRLLGVVFTKEFPFETLSELRILSEIGSVPGESVRGHRDGWGIATFREGKPYYVGRSTNAAFRDKFFSEAIETAKALRPPNILIAHVRAASSGGVSIENTHPFIVEGLVFAHNGTVKGLGSDAKGRQKGQTDSERLAFLVADRMGEKGSLGAAVKSVVKEDIDKREYSAAIMLVSDGKTLVGYRDFVDPSRAQYYGLKMAKCKDSVSLFQEIAVGCDGVLSEIAKRQLVVVNSELKVTTEDL